MMWCMWHGVGGTARTAVTMAQLAPLIDNRMFLVVGSERREDFGTRL